MFKPLILLIFVILSIVYISFTYANWRMFIFNLNNLNSDANTKLTNTKKICKYASFRLSVGVCFFFENLN